VEHESRKSSSNVKPTNPKDVVGIKKPRFYSNVPTGVTREVGIAMMEGSMKYGRHNYRVAGVRAGIYYDAAIGHLNDWWDGQDIDPDSGLHHITKAIAGLYVLRDAQLRKMCKDDRPPPCDIEEDKANMQKIVDKLFDKYPNPKPAYIAGDTKLRK
jgi:hypothetical protein